MFHGTSSVFKDSILSVGLLKNPPQKTWNEGFYKSLDGVYFSFSLDQSLFFASKTASIYGGNQIVVVAEINKEDALPDEDNIAKVIKWSAELCFPKYELSLFEINFFKLMEEIEGIIINQQLKQELKQYLESILNLEIKRKEKDFIKIVKYYDLISIKLKSLVLNSKTIHDKSFRVFDDVKVNNEKNKIISMIEILPFNKIKVIYGRENLPKTIFFQLRKKFLDFELV